MRVLKVGGRLRWIKCLVRGRKGSWLRWKEGEKEEAGGSEIREMALQRGRRCLDFLASLVAPRRRDDVAMSIHTPRSTREKHSEETPIPFPTFLPFSCVGFPRSFS
jgi:hypothetical protein